MISIASLKMKAVRCLPYSDTDRLAQRVMEFTLGDDSVIRELSKAIRDCARFDVPVDFIPPIRYYSMFVQNPNALAKHVVPKASTLTAKPTHIPLAILRTPVAVRTRAVRSTAISSPAARNHSQ